MKKVMAFGTFDILHLGHVKLLTNAKKIGGENAKLIVIIARDENVLKEKHRKPIFPENQRLEMIKALKVVDEAYLGELGDDKFLIIEKIKPDIIVLGYDQNVDEKTMAEELKKRGLSVEIKRLEKYGNDSFNSSSKIIKMVIEKYNENNENNRNRSENKENE
ncbi:MAG: adenylyltransferase/cytidyltransferase family protein [Candidatus Helarchaeota archaeon]